MKLQKSEIYDDTTGFIDCIVEDYDYYQSLINAMAKGEGEIALTRKTLMKKIDETWISVIEASLEALDTVIRNPGKYIKEEEEILPIELSRNIGPRSVRHLAQHTNLIKEFDDKGNITPSKILNVYREETLETYENKFVNTLVDRLYLFVNTRYDKLVQYAKDEYASEMDFEVKLQVDGTDVRMGFQIETKDETPTEKDTKPGDSAQKASLWERLENIKKVVTAYKSSPFIVAMGRNYIRPPIMRTNAIMKNQYLRQCLNLWQFIESYDKAGYDVDAATAAERPPKELLRELYALLAFQFVIFRFNTRSGLKDSIESSAKRLRKHFSPRIIKDLDEDYMSDTDFYEGGGKRSVSAALTAVRQRRLTAEEQKIKDAIDFALLQESKRKAEQKKNNTR